MTKSNAKVNNSSPTPTALPVSNEERPVELETSQTEKQSLVVTDGEKECQSCSVTFFIKILLKSSEMCEFWFLYIFKGNSKISRSSQNRACRVKKSYRSSSKVD